MDMTEPTVYIVQDLGKLNFIPAEEHGLLEVVIDGRVSHVGLKRAFSRMREGMRHITKNDWIIPCGHPALIAYAGAIMSERCGVIRVLAWDNQAQKYIPAEVQTT